MKKGFSILEVVIALAILALIAAAVSGAFWNFRDTRELERSRDEVMNLAREARARTLASESNNQFGVYVEAGRAVLFQGAAYGEGAAGNKAYAYSPRVEAYSIPFSGGAVVFARLTGAASASGTVSFRLKAKPAQTRAFTIQSSGLMYAQ